MTDPGAQNRDDAMGSLVGAQQAQRTLEERLRVEAAEHQAEAAEGADVPQARLQRLYRSRIYRRLGDARRGVGRIPRPTTSVRVPLAGLPAAAVPHRQLDWRDEVIVDGEPLPAVHADPPLTLTFRLVATSGVRLRAYAALRPGAWRHNRGGVRFTAMTFGPQGDERARTVVDVDPSANPRHRRWLPVDLTLDVNEVEACEVRLVTELTPGADAEYAWAVWGDPVLHIRRAARAVPMRPASPRPRDGEQPLISVLMPVHDPDAALLQAALDSVIAQTSRRWELCVVDDGSRSPAVIGALELAATDPRVLLRRHAHAQGISAATNAAFEVSSGAYVATLDHDDVLSPDAIARIQAVLMERPELDLVYADNDKVMPDGVRFAASLKPDWSPELLRACMYTLHPSIYRRSLVEDIGGWRPEFDGAQDHDLQLRIVERTDRIGHLPETLYGWRVHAGSAALGDQAKPAAYERGCRAVQEHLERTGTSARAQALPIAGRYRVIHRLDPTLRVSVILPLSADLRRPGLAEDARRVLEELQRVDHDHLELVVVPVPETDDAGARAADLATVLDARDGAWGSLAAAGAAVASGKVLVFLEELATPRNAEWLAELVGLAHEPAIGAAGGLVADGDGSVVHAGVAMPCGLPLPVHPGARVDGETVPDELTMVTNRTAVSGVVAIRASTLREVGGIARDLERLALVDLSTRLSDAGQRVVCTPHARFDLVTLSARGWTTNLGELAAFAWARGARPDPYYNPRLWADRAAHVVPRAIQRAGLFGDLDARAR